MKTIWIVIGLIVVIALGWWLLGMQKAQAPATSADSGQVQGASGEFSDNSKDSAPDSSSGSAPSSGASAGVSAGVTVGQPVSAFTVKYTNQGFEPSTLSVPVGATVTFVNQGTGAMWIASANHPSHTTYDGTSKDAHCAASYTGPKPFDECGTSGTYSFTFTKAGTFGYHNHVNANDTGTIVVK